MGKKKGKEIRVFHQTNYLLLFAAVPQVLLTFPKQCLSISENRNSNKEMCLQHCTEIEKWHHWGADECNKEANGLLLSCHWPCHFVAMAWLIRMWPTPAVLTHPSLPFYHVLIHKVITPTSFFLEYCNWKLFSYWFQHLKKKKKNLRSTILICQVSVFLKLKLKIEVGT